MKALQSSEPSEEVPVRQVAHGGISGARESQLCFTKGDKKDRRPSCVHSPVDGSMRSFLTTARRSSFPLDQPLYGAGKRFALFLFYILGAFRLAEYRSRRNLIVLTYHRIVPRNQCENGWRPSNSLFSDEFEKQIEFVGKRFNVLTGDQLRAVISGRAVVPRYSLAITFDDGYENNYTHAFPILKRNGLHAVFFVTTNLIGKKDQFLWFDRLERLLSLFPSPNILECLRMDDQQVPALSVAQIRSYFKMLSGARQSEMLDCLEKHFNCAGHRFDDLTTYGMMNWEQICLMASAGMTIGSHTLSHQILAAVPVVDAYREVLSSRERIQEEIGQDCWCFSYPNGEIQDFRPSDEQAIKSAGYLCAFTQIPGSINSHTPRYALPRIGIPDTGDMRIFRSYVSGLQRGFRSILPLK